MSSSPAPGTLDISCPDACKSNRHALAEKYYDGDVFVYPTITGVHGEVIKTLTPLIYQYLDVVDSESTFYLSPVKLARVDVLAALFGEDIQEGALGG